MKKILGAVFAALFLVLALAKSAPAMDRVQWLFGLNPPSSWANYAQRYTRIGFGQLMYDALGRTTNGLYSNCTVQVSSGLNVVVGPAGANTNCSLYQYLAEEATSFGGPGGTALASDPNQVYLQGLIYGGSTTVAIGPLSPGTSGGQSIDNLLECKVLTVDQTSQTGTFISALGVVTTSAVNRDRSDTVSCQNKAGTSATTGTQVVPTVDSGWVAIGYVAIANGVSTITGGMINALTQSLFYGFPQLQAAMTFNTAPAATTVYQNQMPFVYAIFLGQPNVSGNQALMIGNTSGASGSLHYTDVTANAGLSAAGVTGTVLDIRDENTSGASGLETAIDANGNLGQRGDVVAGGASIFANSASNGLFIAGNLGGNTNAMAFGNTAGAGTAGTQIGSASGFTVNTITGTCAFIAQLGSGNGVTIDCSGNMGISGTLHQTSSIKKKRDMEYVTPDWALGLARKTSLITFCYKAEDTKTCGPNGGVPFHVSFPAEYTPAALSGNQHNQVEPMTLAAVALGAAKAVDQHEVADAKSHDADVAALWLQVKTLYALVALLAISLVIITLRTSRRP